VAGNRGAEVVATNGGTGRFQRAKSPGPGGKGARRDVGVEGIRGGVGEVGGSPTRPSAVVHVERGGAAVRG
jgi:hypothetical protein